MNLRTFAKRLAALERRVATMILPGTAARSEGSRTVARFDDKGVDGQPFESPALSHVASSGKTGGGVSRFSRIGDGEPVLVLSPGGELGKHSRIMPAGPVDDHPSPGTAEQNGDLLEVGNAAWAVKDGEIRASVGGSSLVMTAGSITLKAAAIRLEQG